MLKYAALLSLALGLVMSGLVRIPLVQEPPAYARFGLDAAILIGVGVKGRRRAAQKGEGQADRAEQRVRGPARSDPALSGHPSPHA